MPIFDLTCDNNHEQYDQYLKVGERPPCPTCGEPTRMLWLGKANGVIDDSIPGGLEVRHGPIGKYYSKTDLAKAAKAQGWQSHVEHVTSPISGSDKNKFTSRWI